MLGNCLPSLQGSESGYDRLCLVALYLKGQENFSGALVPPSTADAPWVGWELTIERRKR